VGESFGYGGLGLKGTGRGGGGTGRGKIGLGSLSGVGDGARPSKAPSIRPPTVRMGTAAVRGSLSRQVIQREIRLRQAALRAPYERLLTRDPSAEGRVVVRLVIGPDGRVVNASVASSTLGNAQMERELLEVFRRMQFPAVAGGGTVIVTYPLVFRPGRGE
jgi:TonB family protein